ncbi:hypothetical protein AB6A40_008075 [Gnathostoma spinigerum]|uniref:RING-type domain-containing protein n=1 Tax=Gnathostoma spinigerum TaxID=75299 RepID=A0ABD6ENI8_9BILA
MKSDDSHVSARKRSCNGITCEICLETLHYNEGRLQHFSCGHVVCKECMFTLRCHQQYYLLDSLSCPTCRLPNNIFSPPITDEPSDSTQSIADVTVINVQSLSKASDAIITTYQNSGRVRCVRCATDLSAQSKQRLAQCCLQCEYGEQQLQLYCLECCVSVHSGHPLITFETLEYECKRLLNEMEELKRAMLEMKLLMDEATEVLNDVSNRRFYCATLTAARQKSFAICIAEVQFAISSLEKMNDTPMAPSVITSLRQSQFRISAKVQRLMKFTEKLMNAVKLADSRQTPASPAMFKECTHSALSKPKFYYGEKMESTIDAICLLLAACRKNGHMKKVKGLLTLLVGRSSSKECRKTALFAIARQIRLLVEEDLDEKCLQLTVDVYRCIFCNLNIMLPYGSKRAGKFGRTDVWKCIQMAYSGLLRNIGGFQGRTGPIRMDLLEDLAFLCSLYSDVCDQATTVLCMLELARARVAIAEPQDESLSSNPYNELRLQMIDEDLFECQRSQQLENKKSMEKKNRAGKVVKHVFRKNIKT